MSDRDAQRGEPAVSDSELEQQSVGLASLADDDPQRLAAYARAEHDLELRKVLDEGERLMELLALAKPPPPTEDALQRASAAVLAEMDAESQSLDEAVKVPGRSVGMSRLPFVLPIAALVGPLMVLAMHHSHLDRGGFPVALVLLGVALAGAASVRLLGRPLLLASLALGGAYVGLVAKGWGAVGPGGGCLMMTVISGAAPLIAAVGFALRGRLRGQSPLSLAGVAAVGALAGTAALHIACPGHGGAHLLAFHLGGIAISAAMGLVAGIVPPVRRALAG